MLVFRVHAAESIGSLRAILTTNYIVVTNIVVTTNYAPVSDLKNTTNPPNLALPALTWTPPEDGYDWIQLKSGEWLKGQLKAMQGRSLEFYSEELGDQNFNWKDIRQVRSPHTIDVLAVDGKRTSGPITVTPDQVCVVGAESCVIPREQVQSLTPGGSRRNYWSGDLSLGFNLQSGNTKQVDYNANFDLQRRSPETRFSL